MYPKLKERKKKIKIKVANYIYEIKNSLFGILKALTDFHYLILCLKRNFHF